MSRFTTNFKGELIGKNVWKNIEAFTYHVGKYPSKEIIKVPKGFVTDFASVPRIFWSIISPIDNHAKADVIHDYCYKTELYDRKKSDNIFHEALKVLNVPRWKIWLMYYNVRLFGWIAWKKDRRKQKKEL